MEDFLRDYQRDAVKRMHNGCILNGGVGSGKSRTGLYYYFKEQGGSIDPDYIPMKNPKDLYIITTAMKRDSLEWEGELANFLISKNPEVSFYKNNIVIDSWNNIQKYKGVFGAFFIFDEDRLTGKGKWVKAFWDIARKNDMELYYRQHQEILGSNIFPYLRLTDSTKQKENSSTSMLYILPIQSIQRSIVILILDVSFD